MLSALIYSNAGLKTTQTHYREMSIINRPTVNQSNDCSLTAGSGC
uniref:Uncharacterized protein n=1 Tax=Anguilla anguilla TaxID=7936 RepID=A0A0E9TY24_ANGAN